MFDSIIHFFESIDPILAAFLATTFTWGLTAFGASFVFFFKTMNRVVLDGMLGFTGGVMVAASFWSLLAPAIEMSEGDGIEFYLPRKSLTENDTTKAGIIYYSTCFDKAEANKDKYFLRIKY